MSPELKKLGRPKDPSLEARRQEEILTAAAKAFAQQGFANTDVQAIADDLGIGKGTVYRYFPTKEDLFLAAVDRGLQDLSAAIDAVVVDESVDPLVRFESAVFAYLTFFHDR